MRRIKFFLVVLSLFLLSVSPAFGVAKNDLKVVLNNAGYSQAVTNLDNGLWHATGTRLYIPKNAPNTIKGMLELTTNGYKNTDGSTVYYKGNYWVYIDFSSEGISTPKSLFLDGGLTLSSFKYWDTFVMSYPGNNPIGGLGSFLANYPPLVVEGESPGATVTMEGVQNLLPGLGRILLNIFPIGLGIFSALLLVRLIPRLMRLFRA